MLDSSKRVRRYSTIVGWSAVLGGLFALVSLPLLVATADSFQQLNEYVLWTRWGYMLGSCVFVWGIWTIVDSELRSLTPPRAFVAPFVAMVPWPLSRSIHPPSTELPPWRAYDTVLHTIADMLHTVDGSIATPVFLGVGVAIARNDRRWAAAGLGLVLAISLANGLLDARAGPMLPLVSLESVVVTWGYAVIHGILPFAFGYIAARPISQSARFVSAGMGE